MEASAYPIGQAVFLQTDTPDYAEKIVPFTNLEELVRVCSQPQANLIIEKIIVYAMPAGEPVALTLGFVAATKGQRPQTVTAPQ
jgi:hypothetical protein